LAAIFAPENRDWLGSRLATFVFDYFWHFHQLADYLVRCGFDIKDAAIERLFVGLEFANPGLGGRSFAGLGPARARKTITSLPQRAVDHSAAYATSKDIAVVLIRGACGLSTSTNCYCSASYQTTRPCRCCDNSSAISRGLGPVITGVVIRLSGGSHDGVHRAVVMLPPASSIGSSLAP
jgi:hypothetical protein